MLQLPHPLTAHRSASLSPSKVSWNRIAPPEALFALSMLMEMLRTCSGYRSWSGRIMTLFFSPASISQYRHAVSYVFSRFSAPKLYTPPGRTKACGNSSTTSFTHVIPLYSRAGNRSCAPSLMAWAMFSTKLACVGIPSLSMSYIHVARKATVSGQIPSTCCSASSLCLPYTFSGATAMSSVSRPLSLFPLYTWSLEKNTSFAPHLAEASATLHAPSTFTR